MTGFGLLSPLPRRIQLSDSDPPGPRYVDADRAHPSGHALGFAAADDTSAARHLAAMAAQILLSIPRDARQVVVTGRGMLATLVATELATTTAHRGAPDVIIDTTGDPHVLSKAVEGLADLGTLLLAGPSDGRTWPLDTYPDVHSRGLYLRGVKPLADEDGVARSADEPRFVARALAALAVPDENGDLPDGWNWCRVGDA